MTKIVLLLKSVLEFAGFLSGLAAKLFIENRDPTADELADVKARQAAAESEWQSLLPKDGG